MTAVDSPQTPESALLGQIAEENVHREALERKWEGEALKLARQAREVNNLERALAKHWDRWVGLHNQLSELKMREEKGSK